MNKRLYSLEPVFLIRDAKTMKAFADPLRLRLYRALFDKQMGHAKSGKELMVELGEEGNRRIYYHIKQMEEAGLIQKAYEVKKGNLLEAYYIPAAASIEIAPALLQPGGETSALAELVVAYIGAIRADLPFIAEAHAKDTVLSHRQFNLTKAQAERMRQELREIMARYEADSTSENDTTTHRVTIVAYPIKG